MEIQYKIIKKDELNDSYRKIFAEMLRKQGKVQGDLRTKADRCKYICLVEAADQVVAIGAIKPKTESDFSKDKSGLNNLSKDFNWELGYFYTDKTYLGQGIASNITRVLIKTYGNHNLMASTEISDNPAMVRILEKNGFRLFGKPWKSTIHDHYLGLFLKVK